MYRKGKIFLILTLVTVLSLYNYDVKLTNGKMEYLEDNLKVLNENENNYFDDVISKTVTDDNHTFDMIYISSFNVERTYNGLLITWPLVNDSQGHQITYRLKYHEYYGEFDVVGGEEWGWTDWTSIVNTTDNNYLWNHSNHKKIEIQIEATCQYGLSVWGKTDATDTFELTYISTINVEITYYGLLITWPSVNDSQGHQITYILSYTGARMVSGEERVYTHIANTTENNYLWNHNSQELIVISIEATCDYGLSIWGRSSALTTTGYHTLTIPRIQMPIRFSMPNESMTLEWDESIDSYGFPVFYEVYFSVNSQIEWILVETNITRTSISINLTKISNGEYNNNDPPEISEDTGYYLRISAISKISVHSIYDFPDEVKEFITSEIEKNQKLGQEQEITPGWSSIITIFSVVIVIIISRIINIQNRRKIN